MDGRELSSFGDLLRVFRKGKHFTQQQLAGRLGLHRNTIGTWEQGEYLPDTRGMVLELARQLHLEDQETRQLLEASLTTLVPYQQELTIYEQQLGPTHPLTGDALNNLAHLYMDQGK